MSEERAERNPWLLFRLIGGWLLLVVGLVLFPMPIPAGLVLMAGGSAMLIHDSRTFRRFFARLKQRYPQRFSTLHDKAGYLPAWLAQRLRNLLDATDD
jgi:hypothetical protein